MDEYRYNDENDTRVTRENGMEENGMENNEKASMEYNGPEGRNMREFEGHGPEGCGPRGFGPRGPGGFGPRGPEGHGPQGFGPRGPEGHGPRGFGPRGPEGHGPQGFGPRGPEGHGPRGFGPHGPGGFGPRGPQGPGRARPAMRPGFVPEEERRARYESMTTDERITEQIRRLSHCLRMIPGTGDGQRRVLRILLEKGPLSQRELMELAGVRSASLSELAAKLEAGGYVVRFPNPRDHRSMNIALTEAGVAAAESFGGAGADLYGHMTEEEKLSLLASLETLSARWRAMVPGAPMVRVKA